MDKAERVRALLKKHFWDMPDEASLSTGKKTVLPEDALDFFEEYVKQCEVDMAGFNFRQYFPNAGIRFLPNVILPAYLKTDHHKPEPLTVSMLIASAEAGRWLYVSK